MSTYRLLRCPRCGEEIRTYSNPIPTVDIIIEQKGGIVLIERKNAPYGWAIPGGFVDYGERIEEAAVREAGEETGLAVRLRFQLGTYSDPRRDPRGHTISTVFVATAEGSLRAGDDAVRAAIVRPDAPPAELVFDHARIIRDYCAFIRGERSACPVLA